MKEPTAAAPDGKLEQSKDGIVAQSPAQQNRLSDVIDLPSREAIATSPQSQNLTGATETGIGDNTTALTAEGSRHDQSDEDPNAFDDSHLQVDKEKKKGKKKKRKPKSKRGLLAPTGFEEYSADAPITPAEYDEQRKLYDLGLPFTDRILTAIHQYEHRRKMTPVHRDIFYKYLAYGGVEIGPNMFQGISARDAETMDKETLTHAAAQTSLSRELGDIGEESPKWVVDFEGVMKGFLSRRVLFFFALDRETDVHTVTNLLSNFMNYLLHHDVCPEYRESVLAARGVCAQATGELWSARQAGRWLPGDFNIACSTLFGGVYGQRYDGEKSWGECGEGFVGQTDDQARQIVKFAVAGAGTEEQYQLWYQKAIANDIEVTKVRTEIGLEITGTVPPDDETRDFYRQKTKDFRPVGKMYAKGWNNAAAPPDDLTAEEQILRKAALSKAAQTRIASQTICGGEEHEYEFFVEEAILQYLAVGMKIEGTVRTLSCGIDFLDEVFNVYLSIDTFLPNEMMYGYKEGRFVDGYSIGEDGSLKYCPGGAKDEGKDGEEHEDIADN